MIQTCRASRFSLQCGRLPPSRPYISATRLKKREPFEKKSRRVEGESSEPRLNPVVDLHGRIFQEPRKRLWWYEWLNTRSDALKACQKPWVERIQGTGRGGQTNFDPDAMCVQNMVILNNLTARLEKLGVPLPPEKTLYAIRLARREPAAMKQYLARWALVEDERKEALSSESYQVSLEVLSFWRGKPRYRTFRTQDPRLAAQFYNVLTGWDQADAAVEGAPRQQSLYHMLLPSQRPKQNPFEWSAYLRMVGCFGGARAILREWEYFSQTSKRSKEDILNVLDFSGNNFENYRNKVIEILLEFEDWQSAWELAYSGKGHIRKTVGAKTMEQLLRQSHGMKEWQPTMSEPAMTVLAEDLDKIELSLGVRWVGGEDGYHVVQGTPFWATQNVNKNRSISSNNKSNKDAYKRQDFADGDPDE